MVRLGARRCRHEKSGVCVQFDPSFYYSVRDNAAQVETKSRPERRRKETRGSKLNGFEYAAMSHFRKSGDRKCPGDDETEHVWNPIAIASCKVSDLRKGLEA
jgi:hypothetical protein